jgi:hypothetical protein
VELGRRIVHTPVLLASVTSLERGVVEEGLFGKLVRTEFITVKVSVVSVVAV